MSIFIKDYGTEHLVSREHVLGQAADNTGGSKAENKKLFDLVKSLKLPFDQLIWEHGGVWVHVSCGPRNRRQVLSINK
ncbi:MAG: hypothetical protein IJR32_04735 [Paludibacteraceae bacterium]|nr:hypothetical protein [Paludibacteraceae bacterium]